MEVIKINYNNNKEKFKENKKQYLKKIVILLSISAISFQFFVIRDEINRKKMIKMHTGLDLNKPLNKFELKKYIHMLTHGVIEAEQENYGKIDPTPKYIEIALENINNVDDSSYLKTNSKINSILEEFKEGNFENGVILHNIIWEEEDGEVGRAEKLDFEAIEKIHKKYYNNFYPIY